MTRCAECNQPLTEPETAVCGECVEGVGYWPPLSGERDEEGEVTE